MVEILCGQWLITDLNQKVFVVTATDIDGEKMYWYDVYYVAEQNNTKGKLTFW